MANELAAGGRKLQSAMDLIYQYRIEAVAFSLIATFAGVGVRIAVSKSESARI
jgi:hypothetical protein